MLGHARTLHTQNTIQIRLKIKARDDATPEAGGDAAAGLRTLDRTMLPLACKSLYVQHRASIRTQ